MADVNKRYTLRTAASVTSNGHSMTWDTSPLEQPLIPQFWFNKLYNTCCCISATSWKIFISIKTVDEEGTTSLFVQVKRVDGVKVDLDASIRVDIIDAKESHLYPQQIYAKDRMAPGSEIRERVDLVPSVRMEAADNKRLIVRIKLPVTSCHGNE